MVVGKWSEHCPMERPETNEGSHQFGVRKCQNDGSASFVSVGQISVGQSFRAVACKNAACGWAVVHDVGAA